VIVGIISGKIGAIPFKFDFAQHFHNTLNISGKILIFYNIENSVSSICDTLVISPAALTRHDVTRSNLSGDTSAQTCHDGEDTFFASGTNPA
jgi:hypothetical protein